MKTFIASYISVLIPLIAIDALWLSLMASRFYERYIGDLLSDDFHYIPAFLFYLLFALGITVFIVLPHVEYGYTIGMTVLLGALFGAVAYGTYDLTNHATLSEWSSLVTVVDIIWGALLTGVVSMLASYLVQWIL